MSTNSETNKTIKEMEEEWEMMARYWYQHGIVSGCSTKIIPWEQKSKAINLIQQILNQREVIQYQFKQPGPIDVTQFIIDFKTKMARNYPMVKNILFDTIIKEQGLLIETKPIEIQPDETTFLFSPEGKTEVRKEKTNAEEIENYRQFMARKCEEKICSISREAKSKGETENSKDLIQEILNLATAEIKLLIATRNKADKEEKIRLLEKGSYRNNYKYTTFEKVWAEKREKFFAEKGNLKRKHEVGNVEMEEERKFTKN